MSLDRNHKPPKEFDLTHGSSDVQRPGALAGCRPTVGEASLGKPRQCNLRYLKCQSTERVLVPQAVLYPRLSQTHEVRP